MSLNLIGVPSDEQWAKMQNFIKSDKYKKEDFFVFETLAVGDKIVPNRYIKITLELLSTMAEDARKGVSLMLNHNWGQSGIQSIPIGKVFDARISGSSQDGETTTLYITQYILRDDSTVDGYSKNDIIKLIETGILSDTSVGWGTTREAYKCSICGNSIYDYRKCEHIPGRKYIVNEETNEVKLCIIEAHSPSERHAGNNVLIENSVVFDGAYPNAMIQSSFDNINKNTGYKFLQGKEELSEQGFIIGYTTNNSINLLYKEIDEKGGVIDMKEGNITNTNPETESTESTENTENVDNVDNSVETSMSNNGTENLENVDNTENTEIENTETENTENTESTENAETFSETQILEKSGNICESLDELISLAKEGLENRNEIISNALNSGIRSMGNAFNKEAFSNTFKIMKTSEIKKMAEAWETQVSEKFSTTKVSKNNIEDTNKFETDIKINLNDFKTANY